MTPAQVATFKTAMLADPNVQPLITAGDMPTIAAYYNAPSAISVWRPSITVRELNTAIDWTAYAALTVGKQNAYMAMTQGGAIDATSAGIRSGFAAVFGAGTSLTALTVLAQRLATRLEALFVTAQVSSVFGQTVATEDISAALAS